jgi:hypothetical protein
MLWYDEELWFFLVLYFESGDCDCESYSKLTTGVRVLIPFQSLGSSELETFRLVRSVPERSEIGDVPSCKIRRLEESHRTDTTSLL